ncbi:MAG: leucyl/phenylalanyl-tRNA--protein transferase [Devosiaceae bacterium]|nr:leucyl/phenylalanyl-tRNA--protein transferase [Devosiaceae bacterium]
MSHKPDPFEMEFTPELVVRAYQAGIFPMSESASDPDVFWVSPERRGIMPLDGFKTSKSLRKTLKNHPYTIKTDTDFDQIIHACANYGTDRESTWINPTIVDVYGKLFDSKICHTVEIWDGNELVGGLYGLAIGAAFFGESMFHRKTNTSKIALAHLVKRLQVGQFLLLDTQFISPHLKTLGAIEIPRSEYEKLLHNALLEDGDFYRLSGGGTSDDVLQSTSHTS